MSQVPEEAPLTCVPVEARVLGAAMRTPAGLAAVLNSLRPADMWLDLHVQIMELLQEHLEAGTVDVLLLARKLSALTLDLDAYHYLASLVAGAAPEATLPDNIHVVKATANA